MSLSPDGLCRGVLANTLMGGVMKYQLSIRFNKSTIGKKEIEAKDQKELEDKVKKLPGLVKNGKCFCL